MPEENEQQPRIVDVSEKLGNIWLEDLHRKSEVIRAMQMRLASTVDDISEDEAMEIVNRIEHALGILLEQEIRPVAENRDDWEAFRDEAEKMLAHGGLLMLDPQDEGFFGMYLDYCNIVLGRVERYLEDWGMKVTPYPPQPDYVNIAWREIVHEARVHAVARIREAAKDKEASDAG